MEGYYTQGTSEKNRMLLQNVKLFEIVKIDQVIMKDNIKQIKSQ